MSVSLMPQPTPVSPSPLSTCMTVASSPVQARLMPPSTIAPVRDPGEGVPSAPWQGRRPLAKLARTRRLDQDRRRRARHHRRERRLCDRFAVAFPDGAASEALPSLFQLTMQGHRSSGCRGEDTSAGCGSSYTGGPNRGSKARHQAATEKDGSSWQRRLGVWGGVFLGRDVEVGARGLRGRWAWYMCLRGWRHGCCSRS